MQFLVLASSAKGPNTHAKPSRSQLFKVTFQQSIFKSEFSKVNRQKSNSKVQRQRSKVKQRPKSNFPKSNWKRQISNVKFQVEFPKSDFQSEIFQIKLSVKRSNFNFQSRPVKKSLKFSRSTSGHQSVVFQSPLFLKSQTIPIQTLESETFQSPILTGKLFQVKSCKSTFFNFNTSK